MTRPLLRSFGLSQQLLLAFVAGAIGVPAFAPFNLWPLALVSLFVLFLLWREAATTARAFATGFVWGLGLFVAGVSWIFVSLNVYGNMPAILAALATLLFCAYLALFPALAGWLQHWLARRFALSTTWVSLALAPASFALFEYARGWFITGFPWLTSGYSQAPDGWLIGLAPIVGVHGISLVLACTAGVSALPWARTGVRTKTVAVAVLALIWAVAFALHGVAWSESAGKPFRVALLQGNVEQQLKWRDDERARILADYATLLRASHARLIVMPESALPDLLEHIPVEYIDAIRRQGVADGFDAIIGVPLATRAGANEPYAYSNSAISIGVSPPQRYDKQHLVVFGEFVPPMFSWVFRWLTIPMGDFTPGGDNQRPMAIAGQKVAVNICYEDAFGREIARQLPEAELLVNISDMTWFGRSLAPDQQAQFSQMRAIETGRWMLRATNSGVTAAVDERGHIVKALPPFTRGTLEVDVVPRKGTTPYVRVKDWPALALMFGMLIASVLAGRSRSATT